MNFLSPRHMTRGRGIKRARWLYLVFGAMSLAGAALITVDLFSPPDLPSTTPGAPRQASSAPTKSVFTAHLSPAVGSDVAVLAPLLHLLAPVSQRLDTTSRIRISAHLRRTLRNGRLLVSALAADYERIQDDLSRVEIHVIRSHEEALNYFVEFNGLDLKSVAVRAGDQELPIRETEGITSVRIGFGDLDLSDLRGFLQAGATMNVQYLGTLSGHGSTPQHVFDVTLAPKPAPDLAGEASSLPEASSSAQLPTALAMVQASSLRLESVRIFDGQDRLLRTYSNFEFDPGRKPFSLTQFRVDSFLFGSSTVFYIDRVEVF